MFLQSVLKSGDRVASVLVLNPARVYIRVGEIEEAKAVSESLLSHALDNQAAKKALLDLQSR